MENKLKFFLGFVILFIIGGYILIFADNNDENPIFNQSDEFYNCLSELRVVYAKFWNGYDEKIQEEYSPVNIKKFEDTYSSFREYCYRTYYSFFQTFGSSMTNDEIRETIKDLEKYIVPETQRTFESLPIDLKIKFAVFG